MKLYLIIGYTGDYYERFETYAVATNKEDADILKLKASKELSFGSAKYEEIEIEEIEPNTSLLLNL